MKKAILISTFTILTNIATVSAQNVNIPDAIFKAALVGNSSINTNGDVEIQVSEAAAFAGNIYLTGLSITDLTGIEAFTAITSLNCNGNNVSTVNLSANTSLIAIEAGGSQIISLTLPNTNTLTYLVCEYNQLASLDLSGCPSLDEVWCNSNQLTYLDLSNNSNIGFLDCSDNILSSLNTSNHILLHHLFCSNNQLTSLNVSFNIALAVLYCVNNQLTSLSVSTNTALNNLACGGNQLASLSVSTNTTLNNLNCSFNQLTSLSVSSNTALIYLRCSSNQLTSLNMQSGNNSNLFAFFAKNNPNLTCIQVDDAAYMNTNWSNAKDAWASYSVNCNVGIPNYTLSDAVNVYPNPTKGTINLSDFYNLKVTDITGKIILKKQNTNSLDIANQPAGIYFILFTGSTGQFIQRSKLTKE